MSAWVFPVGHYLGPFYPDKDAPAAYHQVRVGHEVVRLFTETELAAWLLAHGLPDTPADQPWTREAMLAAAREQSGTDLSGVIPDLVADGALTEVPEGTDAGVGFAARHRFCPLLVGLGADPRRPDQLLIGLTGNPVVTVDDLGYQVWQWAPSYANLWEACRAFADVDNRSSVRLSGDLIGPEQLLAMVLRRVHRLLTHGAGYLDLTP